MFTHAARLHAGGIAGLAPDEVPAILQRGEEVITRRDPRHRRNQSDLRVHIQIANNTDAQVSAEAESRADGGLDMLIQLDRTVAALVDGGVGIGRTQAALARLGARRPLGSRG